MRALRGGTPPDLRYSCEWYCVRSQWGGCWTTKPSCFRCGLSRLESEAAQGGFTSLPPKGRPPPPPRANGGGLARVPPRETAYPGEPAVQTKAGLPLSEIKPIITPAVTTDTANTSSVRDLKGMEVQIRHHIERERSCRKTTDLEGGEGKELVTESPKQICELLFQRCTGRETLWQNRATAHRCEKPTNAPYGMKR